MTLDDADKLISSYLSSQWTTTPLAWPNLDPRSFSTVGQPLLPQGTAAYVALRSIGRGSKTVTVPGTCIRYSGQLFIASCVKENTGVRQAKVTLSGLIALIENVTLRGSTGILRFGSFTGPACYSTPEGWYVEEIGALYQFERSAQSPHEVLIP
jgi:hypothetical protein